MDRLRRATATLQGTQEQALSRLSDDRARIARILETHPCPDPADRDPEMRAAARAAALSEAQREREARALAAQAAAMDALRGRGLGTRLLVQLGLATAPQRQAERLITDAMALTEEADRAKPTPTSYKEEREHGAALAYAAQRMVVDWEQRPDVARALDDARLNEVVDALARAGDPQVSRALDAGDPEAAREVVRRKEQQLRNGGRPGNDLPRPGKP